MNTISKRVSMVLQALFTCTISDTTKIEIGITTDIVHLISLFFVGAIGINGV